METTISLNNLLHQILGLSLTDQEWLVGKVQENICKQEATERISEEELLAKIDAGLKWTFANQRAELKLQGNDLFNSSTPDGSIDYKGQKLDMKLDNVTRSFVVTFTYKFNGYKKAQYKEVDTSRFGH